MLGCLPIGLLPVGMLLAAGEAGSRELEDVSPRNGSHSSTQGGNKDGVRISYYFVAHRGCPAHY